MVHAPFMEEHGIYTFLGLLCLLSGHQASAATVTGLTPQKGGVAGQVRLTIQGTGFAKNQFNFGAGNANIGNKVTLKGSTRSYDCEVHKDGTHEKQVMCYTPVLPEGTYDVRVKVDGTDVPEASHCSTNKDKCKFTADADRSPTITSISPRSGEPDGTLVTLRGKIFTDRYGSNKPVSPNGNANKILRSYIGGYSCDLKDMSVVDGKPYGIELDSTTTSATTSTTYLDTGTMICKTTGTYIGNVRLSYIVEGEHGRSNPALSVKLQTAQNVVAMFQTYAVIESVSPAAGSLSGGTIVTLTGRNFDKTDAPVTVYIGGTKCDESTYVSATQMTCKAPTKPGSIINAGNRGILKETWTANFKDLASMGTISSLGPSDATYAVSRLEPSYFSDSSSSTQANVKLRAFFVPKLSGKYRIYVKAHGGAIVYLSTDSDPANKVEVASCKTDSDSYSNSQSGEKKESDEIDLVSGNLYYMEVVHRKVDKTSSVNVAARAMDAVKAADETGSVIQEKQQIKFSSNPVPEIQTVTYATMTTATYTKEQQELKLDNINSIHFFRLGLFGVYTAWISSTASVDTIQKALNKLPVLTNKFSVTGSAAGVSATYTIEIDSDMGDLPDFTYKVKPGSGASGSALQVTISQKRQGIAGNDHVTFTLGGTIFPPVSKTATAQELEDALKIGFGVRCPQDLYAQPQAEYKQDCEKSHGTSLLGGRVYTDQEAFCGSGSVKNPWYLYRAGQNGISLTSLQLCFAYRGNMSSSILAKCEKSTINTYRWSRFDTLFEKALIQEWRYKCFTLSNKLHSDCVKLVEIRLDRSDPNLDHWVDSITLTKKDITSESWSDVSEQRYKGAKIGNEVFEKVDVASVTDGYKVTMTPWNCGHNAALLQPYGATGSSPWSVAAGTITNVQDQKATPPITGTIETTFESQKSTLKATSTVDEIENEFKKISNYGVTSVVRTGDCANYKWTIEWLSRKGNLADMTVVDSGLQGSGSATQSTVDDGCTWFDPIPADMLRTIHMKPQVTAVTNNIPTACKGVGTECQYEWLSTSTPSITSINPVQGTLALNTVLTIKGTLFSTDKTKVKVTIEGVECTVLTSTADEITCSVGNGPTGSFDVVVKIEGLGTASGQFKFKYLSEVTSFNPLSGSLGGGTSLTINGHGFSTSATVTINGANCVLTGTIQPGKIICKTPKSATAAAFDVKVSNYGTDLTATQKYTYDNSKTAEITAISPTKLSVFGSQSVTLTGTGFTASQGTVSFAGKAVGSIVSWTDTKIEVVSPPLGPGSHAVEASMASGNGFAKYGSGVGDIEYVLRVDKISPDQGSLYGGTIVTIKGEGFGTAKAQVAADVGGHTCAIQTVTDTQLECMIADTGATKTVTNNGKDKTFGVGYAFDPVMAEVYAGDSVTFSFTQYASNMYGVFETTAYGVTTEKTGGFSSVNTIPQGSISFKFNKVGLYYYWSRYLDSPGTSKKMFGAVNVKERPQSVGNVELKVNGFEANYATTSGATIAPASGCSQLTQDISGCTTAGASVGTPSTKFQFSFKKCRSGEVTSVSNTMSGANYVKATAADEIELKGSGFGSSDCQNIIKFGDFPCTPQSSSTSTVKCKVDTTGSMPIGQSVPITVRNLNRGYSVLTSPALYFYLMPNVAQISPPEGSRGGNTAITITGKGLTKGTVEIDGKACTDVVATYTQITCKTPSSNYAGGSKAVVVKAGDQQLTAECSPTCTFRYTASLEVTKVTPVQVDGSAQTTLTIEGTGFGTSIPAVTVKVGAEACTVVSVKAAEIKCTIRYVAVGNNAVHVEVTSQGLAYQSTPVSVKGIDKLTSVTPVAGSTAGGTLITIQGHGFFGTTSVTVGNQPCTSVTVVSLSSVTCSTPAGTAGSVVITAISNGVTYTDQLNFDFDASKTPTVTNVAPSKGNGGDTVTITGTSFSSTVSDVTVSIDGVSCAVQLASATSITCDLGEHAAGTNLDLVVSIKGLGKSDGSTKFEYELAVASITPAVGSLSGGQLVTLAGKGFDITSSVITICNNKCDLDTSATQTKTSLICKTPSNSATVQTACDVKVVVNNAQQTKNTAYTYDPTKTPSISSVTPSRGGTGGGTEISIAGSLFGTVVNDVKVTIEGIVCTVTAVTDSEIKCNTGASPKTVTTKVMVQIGTGGNAKQNNADFSYIDVWSSAYSWGGSASNIPKAEDLVIIKAGQTILLDTDTPILSMLLIQGGTVIFDEKKVTLNSNYILITDNGTLQVGTEQKPHLSEATIQLHGQLRATELPIYGAKCLAVREGTLDLHGKPLNVTWTVLASTANAGASTITLKVPVDWPVGGEIVIATTGNRHSQGETEKRKISAISADKTTLTLDKALTYKHLGETETIEAGVSFELRAEVGLLSRNIKVLGSRDKQFDETIQACPNGFDTGEFATQTCFQGRFGEESGNDQFGAQIIMHAPKPDLGLVTGRLEYIEVNYAGQAFRLGRYPVHFHINGDMSSSYVRGCAIHETFNRAINIHGTHNVMIERNVVYNVMGGALFIEDGIETGNIYQYNLALFVKASSSLLNDDITPAAIWVTNPNNTYRHNHAAGGTHFGFWYRMHEHPDGPSFDSSIHPRKVPMGEFSNNTVHSFGWMGLWIFQDYDPREGGNPNGKQIPAVFDRLTIWSCEKGAEAVNVGTVQFKNFKMISNEKAGLEGKRAFVDNCTCNSNGYLFEDAVIVAYSNILDDEPGFTSVKGTVGGIVLPYGQGVVISGIKFYRFDKAGIFAFTFTKIDGTCSVYCGGYSYCISKLAFKDTTNKIRFDWDHEGVLADTDGTLTGEVGKKVLPKVGFLPPGRCADAPAAFSNGAVPAAICDATTRFHRMSFNHPLPSSLAGNDVVLSLGSTGNSSGKYAKKRLTHKLGWTVLLLGGQTPYDVVFHNMEHMTNISYDAMFSQFEKPDDCLILCHKMEKTPDNFYYDGKTSSPMASKELDCNVNDDGDWYFNNSTMKLCYMVHTRSSQSATCDRNVVMKAYKCYYENCTVPDPSKNPPNCNRPSNKTTWSTFSWSSLTSASTCLTFRNGACQPPTSTGADDVLIPKGHWMMLDQDIKVRHLIIHGTLEVADGATVKISAEIIYILRGQLIIGCDENNPFTGNVVIELRGTPSTDAWDTLNGPQVGRKAIGNFGNLALHGKSPGTTWLNLKKTAAVGASSITLNKAVHTTWQVGNEIVITSTSFKPKEAEVAKIKTISSDSDGDTVLGLEVPLKYRHLVTNVSKAEYKYSFAAEVGLLTRNIKIVGEDYSNIEQEGLGGRVLVGATVSDGFTQKGYGRFSNVEFHRTGQLGYTESYDPRFSVSFVETGDATDSNQPSYVKGCSFHHGYGSGIGVFGAENLQIYQNVMYRTVGSAIHTTSSATGVIENLISLMESEKTFGTRFEKSDLKIPTQVNAIAGKDLRLNGNAISSSEGIAVRFAPEEKNPLHPRGDNVIHSSMIGIGNMPGDTSFYDTTERDTQYANFKVYKCFDYGLYIEVPISITIANATLIDNGISVFPYVYGVTSFHDYDTRKRVRFSNSLVIGKSENFDCSLDKIDTADDNFKASSMVRGYRRDGNYADGGFIGFILGPFATGGNAAPFMPLANIMTYPAIAGLTQLEDLIFAEFDDTCNGQSVAIAAHKNNDDGIHPTTMKNVKMPNVNEKNQIFYPRPRVGTINPSDCVDMDCDGLKKVMIEDTDGSFLGSKGTILPQSEYEWDGDARRGLGDYRIPKTMLTDNNNNKISAATLAPKKGVLRDSTCVTKTAWNAHVCTKFEYKMLIIESMDSDTETRRLSPIAFLAHDDANTGYIDLINGPQDHGWCAGYTCQKRLSTFMALVAKGRNHTMYMTSTPPQHLRFYVLNSEATEKVQLAVYYPTPYRLDVYYKGGYVEPKNSYKDSNGKMLLNPAQADPEHDRPNPSTEPCGTNYLDQSWKLQYLVACGSGADKNGHVEIKMTAAVIVSISTPAISIDEFFGKNLVNNLALFLKIPSNKIRVVNTVSVSGNTGKRRKRALDQATVSVEIADVPCSNIDCAGEDLTLPYENLVVLASDIMNAYQLGNLSEIINITLNGMAVQEAVPPETDPAWQSVLQKTTASEFLLIPTQLTFHSVITAGSEGNVFTQQPILKLLDSSNMHVTVLGAVSIPWKVKATLRVGSGSNNQAILIGNDTVDFSNGWANFTNLGISHSGTGFIIDFEVIFPTEATFTVESAALEVTARNLKAMVVKASGDVYENQPHTFTVQLYDADTNVQVQDIAWSGHQWTAAITASSKSSYTGTTTGTSSGTLNPVSGELVINDYVLDKKGMQVFDVAVTSSPADYSLTTDFSLTAQNADLQSITVDTASTVSIKIAADYNTYGNQGFATAYVNKKFDEENYPFKVDNVVVSEGSVVITATISGNTTTVTLLVDSICTDITSSNTFTYNGQTFDLSKFMTLNGATYYGAGCGSTPDSEKEKEKESETQIGLIAGLVAAVVVILILCAIILYWKLKVLPKTKTHKMEPRYLGTTVGGEHVLWREDTFMSIREKYLPDRPVPAIHTSYVGAFDKKGDGVLEKPPISPPPSYRRTLNSQHF